VFRYLHLQSTIMKTIITLFSTTFLFLMLSINPNEGHAQCNVTAYILDWNGPTTYCSGDGSSDFFGPGIINVGYSGQNQAFVITDENGVISYAGGTFFTEFEGSDPGICYVYSCNYQDGLIGLSIEQNIAGLSGCFDLSIPIIITKLEAGCLDVVACNYNANAECPGAPCLYNGCTDPLACNYIAGCEIDNGSCIYAGCADASACNFDLNAGCDDGSCILPCPGFDCSGNCIDQDNDLICDYLEISGCTDPVAINYNVAFTNNDGSCIYGDSLCGQGTIWDDQSLSCISACDNPCPADTNTDGIINTADLLILLSVFGTICQ